MICHSISSQASFRIFLIEHLLFIGCLTYLVIEFFSLADLSFFQVDYAYMMDLDSLGFNVKVVITFIFILNHLILANRK